MKVKKYALLILPLLFVFSGLFVFASAGSIKEPNVAGAFYPGDRKVLSDTVKAFLAHAEPDGTEGDLIALIAPHAGYQYSGRIAAHAYRQLEGRTIDTVVLIGPSHYASFSGAALLTEGKMRTPLGDVRINKKIAGSLLNEKTHVNSRPEAFAKEHSLEVQLPFLQTVLKDFTIVPVLIGAPTRESFQFLSSTLANLMKKNRNVLLIASTDLSHYHDYAAAEKMDRKVIDAAARMSSGDLERLLSTGEGEMCGGFPVLYAMAAARKLGATHGVLYGSANSGDVTGDRSRVVGYAAMGLYKSPLSKEERQELLALARTSVDAHVRHGRTPSYEPKNQRLRANGAAFVTLNRKGSFRGCIGNLEPMMPLYQAVQRNAVYACSRDQRFAPVAKDELTELDLEVTVLSPLEQLENVKDIRIGTHGLYIMKGQNTGILLPQVAEEYKWDVPTFLHQVSLKAGLPGEAWKDAELFTFTADIIR